MDSGIPIWTPLKGLIPYNVLAEIRYGQYQVGWHNIYEERIKTIIMKIINNIIGGLAGAVALNILHESVKRIDHAAPRVDLVGEEALDKILEKTDNKPLEGNILYTATLAGDLLSNAFYYSLIGVGNKKHIFLRGAIYGTAAGIGALELTRPMGLSDAPVTRTDETKILTVGYYLLGGFIAAWAIKNLTERSR
jgi:hypothetical protein